jgi:hypothetical protein
MAKDPFTLSVAVGLGRVVSLGVDLPSSTMEGRTKEHNTRALGRWRVVSRRRRAADDDAAWLRRFLFVCLFRKTYLHLVFHFLRRALSLVIIVSSSSRAVHRHFALRERQLSNTRVGPQARHRNCIFFFFFFFF